jgi:hypothetical protein
MSKVHSFGAGIIAGSGAAGAIHAAVAMTVMPQIIKFLIISPLWKTDAFYFF